MKIEHRTFLERFGERVTFDPTERRLYGHDVGAVPGLIALLMRGTTPDAVVQPNGEQELAALARWAAAEGVPLTPRGKATSGYGGAVPQRRGVVVDFHRMRRVLRVDPAALEVEVEPGITWAQLDTVLAEHDLALRLYPTSYPSSTVGGWLAQGGAGIGSFEHGYFRESVVSARVVLPDGEAQELRGDGLDLVADAEGITGLISRVTLRVMPREEIRTAAVALPDAASLQGFVRAVVDRGLPIWSLGFVNPTMARLRNQAPRSAHGAHEPVMLPEAYVLTLAFRARDGLRVQVALPALASSHGAQILGEDIARHEWDERFKIMAIKRLGPSLVPAEVILPLDGLARTLEEIGRAVAQPFALEGVAIRRGRGGRPEVVILGFIPADQRTAGYNLVFGLALTVLKVAEKHGGRAYATGSYFAGRAGQVLGERQRDRLRAFKREHDARNIMNPGKVLDGGLVGAALNLAGPLEPLVRRLGNARPVQVGERVARPVRDIPADVAWYAYACAQCGACVDDCPQFYGRGWESHSPRGKWFWLREHMEGRAEWNQKMVDTFLACTTCETCVVRCSANLPVEPAWLALRGELVQKQGRMTFPPFEIMGAALAAEGNIWAGYRKDRAAWFPADLRERHGPDHKARAVYFAGCTASYVEHDIAIGSVRLLDAAGVDFTYLGEHESCCATPMLVAGRWDLFVETMKKNIQAVRDAGADTVISSCPACDMMWRQVYPQWAAKLGIEYGITARHYSELVAEKIRAGEFQFPPNEQPPVTVTWHDSCHIGRASGVYEPPREVIKAIPNVNFVEMAHNRACGRCCGSVLTLIHEPEVAAELGTVRLDEATDVGAEKVLALCPCCEFQLRVTADRKQLPLEIVDLSRFAAEALGFTLPDPHPEVRAQWAVFEKMIALMTPQGFAGLMGTMWPEIVDAMPLGMGAMMRAMGRVPGALEAMRPMFPLLFPRLLPLMLPKLMPAMLERVGQMIPMPEYMAAQMPDLMPKVMDRLLPHMIGDVVPLVTQPLIDYLHGASLHR
ncbi:MAG TPA: FAD-binding and (Fe-S)-binding domain-containing protein [Roseiflexaceae bacterium]|nr:FAD-binding and (Fe-S)-binding domain-containing protein [Roseiflexaceae bacterium]